MSLYNAFAFVRIVSSSQFLLALSKSLMYLASCLNDSSYKALRILSFISPQALLVNVTAKVFL